MIEKYGKIQQGKILKITEYLKGTGYSEGEFIIYDVIARCNPTENAIIGFVKQVIDRPSSWNTPYRNLLDSFCRSQPAWSEEELLIWEMEIN
ncbi:MAG: hypothetical protein WC284_14620 [Candidimonas sp.]